jgi:hypothetical protein
MPVRGKIHQDGHRITSTVRHAAKPHLKTHGTTVSRLPLVYKRRRWPPSHGGQRIAHSFTLPPSLTILALASIRSQGTGGFSSSPLACIPLYEHHGALQYSAPSAPLLDVRPTAGTRINLVSQCCLALAIERPISALLLVSVGTTFRTDNA